MEVLFVAIATLLGGALAGYIAAWVQMRYQLRQFRQAEEKAEQRLRQLEIAYERLNPINSVRVLFEMHQYDAAVELSSALLQTDPKNVDAHYLRGRTYAELRQTERAVADLRGAAKLAPDRPEIQLALGLSEFALGNWSRAGEAARSAIAGEVSDHALATTLLGDALRRDKRFDEAITAYCQCLTSYPMHTPSIDGAGQAMLALVTQGKGTYDQVVEWYDKYIDVNPTASSTLIGRALALFMRNDPGDHDNSFRDLEKAAALSGGGTQAYETAGKLCLHLAEEQDDEGLCRTLARRSLGLFTQAFNRATKSYRPAIRNQISYVHTILGDHAEAIREARHAVNESSVFPANHQTLVCAFMAASKWSEAISHCREWLGSPYAAQSLPGRVWIGGFLSLARLAHSDSLDDVRDDLLAFCQDLQSFPEFVPIWEWSAAKDRVLQSMKGKGDSEELVKSLIALLDRQMHVEEFRKTWQLQTRTGIPPTPPKSGD